MERSPASWAKEYARSKMAWEGDKKEETTGEKKAKEEIAEEIKPLNPQ